MHTFKPRFKTRIVSFLGTLMGIISGILLIFLAIYNSNIWIKILLVLFLIPTTRLIFITIVYPLKVRLIISDIGIFYQHPDYSVFCYWKDIKEIELTSDHLIVKYDENILRNKSSHVRKSVSNTIPISNFVKSFRKKKDWDDDLILSTLKNKIPISDTEIQKYFK